MLTISVLIFFIIFLLFTICAASLHVYLRSSVHVIIVILFREMFIFLCLKAKRRLK